MHYINQLDYPHLPYPYDPPADNPSNAASTIAKAGCGLCSLCMIVENLTMRRLDIRDAVDLAVQAHATSPSGTSMRKLGPVAAERYALTYETTSDAQTLAAHLGKGGMAIANVAGSLSSKAGYFSTRGGHYIVVVSYDGEDVCILDPSYTTEKYEDPSRAEKIRVDRPFLYCSMETLMEATALRDPRFYLFARKKP